MADTDTTGACRLCGGQNGQHRQVRRLGPSAARLDALGKRVIAEPDNTEAAVDFGMSMFFAGLFAVHEKWVQCPEQLALGRRRA